MPEAGGSNIEIAHHLSEHEPAESAGHAILEILEALVLAIVAIAMMPDFPAWRTDLRPRSSINLSARGIPCRFRRSRPGVTG